MHRSLRASVIAPTVAGVLAATAIAFAGSFGVHRSVDVDRTAPKRLRIHGHVTQLRPGHTRTYSIHVLNPLPAAVVVREVRARVRRGSGPDGTCPAKYLHIRRWHGRRSIPATSHGTIRLTVRFRGDAPSRCIGARWPIHYAARSVRR